MGSGHMTPSASTVISGFMADYFFRLLGIFLLRAGPQDLPARASVLILTVLAYAVLAGVSIVLGASEHDPLAPVLASIILTCVLTWLVLRVAGTSARWLQTVTALFGTSLFFRLINLPLAMAGENPSAPAALLALGGFFWHFAVHGHIFRHALEVSFSFGVAVAVGLFAAGYFILINVPGLL